MSGDDFREHLYHLKIWRRELAEFAGVSLRTVNRWCTSGAPLYAVRLADACAGVIRGNGRFDGWIADRDHLTGPSGERYTLEDMRAAHWLRQLHDTAERQSGEAVKGGASTRPKATRHRQPTSAKTNTRCLRTRRAPACGYRRRCAPLDSLP